MNVVLRHRTQGYMTFERSHDLKKSLYFKRVIKNKANIMNKAIINKANFLVYWKGVIRKTSITFFLDSLDSNRINIAKYTLFLPTEDIYKK